MIECVPNVSEGRRLDIVDELAAAIRGVPGVRLLDYSADGAHHRSVFTFVGEAVPLADAVMALYHTAILAIDMRRHRGEHPRIGAVDVVPFVPLGHTTLDACVALARTVGRAVADRHGLPVFLYEAAASRPDRRNLTHVRQGEFEGLANRLTTEAGAPDFGPAVPHPTAGASAIGARPVLVAYNVNLDTDNLADARAIAKTVRESSGGLPAVKALGLRLAARGIVQVSMNLTDYTRTSMRDAYTVVRREAERRGVGVVESELIGLAPAAAFGTASYDEIQLVGPSQNRTIEDRLRVVP